MLHWVAPAWNGPQQSRFFFRVTEFSKLEEAIVSCTGIAYSVIGTVLLHGQLELCKYANIILRKASIRCYVRYNLIHGSPPGT